MKKVIRLTESDLIRVVKRIVKEQEDSGENSYDNCNFANSTFAPSTKWNGLSDEKKQNLLNKLKIESLNIVKRCNYEYKNWYNGEGTKKKFKPNELKIVKSRLGPYLDKITKINLSFNAPKPTVIAWVNSKDRNTINLNVPMIHNTEKYVGPTLYETIKHEIGHLIDYFFKDNNIRTYLDTVDAPTQDSYEQNYAINDKDQFTRLNVLRSYIGAGPADHPSVLMKKFMNKVNEGLITSNYYKFAGGTLSTQTTKNSNQKAQEINKYLINKIFYKGKPSMNIEQLFATFAFMKGNDIYVNFDLIANLNITSKDLNKKYHYLKLSPK
jgi:hypothetical protein